MGRYVGNGMAWVTVGNGNSTIDGFFFAGNTLMILSLYSQDGHGGYRRQLVDGN